MTEPIVLEKTVLGWPLRVMVQPMGQDLQVTVTGGVRPHIGAVTTAWWQDGKLVQQTALLPTHRDDVVSRMFAVALAEHLGSSVSVSCGIHYDGVDSRQIDQVVDAARELLEELEQALRQ